ncbi:hypothetical protein [Conexibacter sp. DBS9H8]|uniref:hypothetical protein n=1 Tax=Conexibacter sp. DBS9H8 TaxID=2937801 RepID=UPI00200D3974|nr:hypothetical protein [Conexibacter sp. DBS9H8]
MPAAVRVVDEVPEQQRPRLGSGPRRRATEQHPRSPVRVQLGDDPGVEDEQERDRGEDRLDRDEQAGGEQERVPSYERGASSAKPVDR